MALPSTGAISLLDVRNELGKTGAISLGDSAVRALAGKTSGAISLGDLRGKSSFAYTHKITVGVATPSSSNYIANTAYGYMKPGYLGVDKCGSITPDLINNHQFHNLSVWIEGGKYLFTCFTTGPIKTFTCTLPNGSSVKFKDDWEAYEVSSSFYQYFVQNLNKTINIRIE